jgi:CDP-glucose 4,6-dehydratase
VGERSRAVEGVGVNPAFWRDRPVLVTGAFGFLGSHLTGMLVDAGAAVVALRRDQLPAPPTVRDWVSKVTIVDGDVRDQPLLERVLNEFDIDTVFHLAAQTQVGVSNRGAVSTLDSNIRGTWTLLEAVHRTPQVARVVVASSDKAFGTQPALPYTEEMPLLAVHPYDVSKACADMLTMSYAEVFDVPAAITRCGNFFGPGDVNWARLVPGTGRSLLRGERPVIRSDGSLVRDYLYVVDGALAYVALAEAMASDPDSTVGQAFNFSTETQLDVLQFVTLIAKAVGRTDLDPDVQATATHEIPHQYLSAARARRVLAWTPRWTVEEALDQTVAWSRGWLCASS